MDGASYHVRQDGKASPASAKTQVMIDWLIANDYQDPIAANGKTSANKVLSDLSKV